MASASESKDIKVLTWNINGLKAKLADEDRKNKLLDIFDKYHVVLLQETKIGPKDGDDDHDRDWKTMTDALPEKYSLQKLNDLTCREGTDEEEEEEEEDEDEDEEEEVEEEEVEEEEEEEEVEEEEKTMYMTYFSSKKRGVAILINKPHTLLNYSCEGGDYAWVHVEIGNQKYTFVSVYYRGGGRNRIGRLMSNISTCLKDADAFKRILVIGGDFNTTLDPELDANRENPKHALLRKTLNDFTSVSKLSDVWRNKHPRARQYTYTHHNGTQSRLDYFFMLENDVTYVKACEILPKKYVRRCDTIPKCKALSDHSPVKLTLNYPDMLMIIRMLESLLTLNKRKEE